MRRAVSTPAAILVLLAANNVLRNIGLSMVNIALPVHVRDVLGMDYGAYGILLGAFSIINALLEPVFAHFAERAGFKRVIVLALGIFLGGTIACAMATTFWELLVARLVQGCGSFYSAMFLFIDRTSSNEGRSRAFAIFMVSMTVGWILGTVVGGVLAVQLPMQVIFLLKAGLIGACMVSCLVLPGKEAEAGVMRTTPPGEVTTGAGTGTWAGRGDYAKLVALNTIRHLVFAAVLSFLLFYTSIFLDLWGVDIALSGLLILPTVGSYITFTLLGGSARLIKKVGTRLPAVLAFVMLVPAFAVFGTFFSAMIALPLTIAIGVFFAFTMFTSSGFGLPQASLATRMMNLLPVHRKGALSGAYNTAGFLAHAAGPVLLSLVVEWEQGGNILASPHVSFIITAVLAACGAVLALLLKREHHG